MILCSLCVSVKVSLLSNEFFASNGNNEKDTKYNRFHLCIHTDRRHYMTRTEILSLRNFCYWFCCFVCVCVLWFGFRYAHFIFSLNSVVFLFRSYVGCISLFCFAVAFDNFATNWLYSTSIVYCFFFVVAVLSNFFLQFLWLKFCLRCSHNAITVLSFLSSLLSSSLSSLASWNSV